jgi:sugar/nucleoside kinase (ribokinase family)
MTFKKYDIVVIGNCTEDRLPTNNGVVSRLGGSPSYIFSLLNALDVNCSVYSKLWPEFPFFNELPFKPLPNKSETKPLVCKLLNETTGKNHVFLTSSEKIQPEDIDFTSKISIISGVMEEVPPETIEKVRERSDITIVDTQMMMRGLDLDGNVFLKEFNKTEYFNVIHLFDYLKVSETEFKFLGIGVGDRPKILLTLGPKGCKIITKTQEKLIPTTPLEEIESNGSGDMFLAGFAYALLNGCDEETAVKIGNYCGGLAVRAVGIPKLSEKEIKTIKEMVKTE